MPDCVVSSWQIDKHRTSLLLGLKRILIVLSKQNSLIYSLPSPSEPSLFPKENWVSNRLNTSVYEPLEGGSCRGHKSRRWDNSFGSSTGFLGLGIATTSALLETFGILRCSKQGERKPHNQDFSAAPAWVISSGQIEPEPGAFPGFRYLRAAANSLEVKLSYMFTGLVGLALQRPHSSCEMSRDDSRSIPSYLPFLISWNAIALAGTAQ